MPIHLRANRDDVAPVALLVGDPGRATRMAGQLEGARCYNQNRGLLGFTGTFENAAVSVQTTGMGGPSAAIVVEELCSLGVNTVIRLGTCGAVGPNVKVLDLVVATAAVPADGTTRQYLDGEPFAPVADLAVANALVDACRSLGRPFHTGLVMSQDAFYLQDRDWERWRDRGVLAVEMETSTVFTLALLRRLRAGAVCLAVDDIADRSTWASEEAISAATTDLITAGLAAAHRLSRS